VLDIACGDGRNSLYLLEKGFDVTGIDFSTEGLERLNRFAEKYGDHLETKRLDLADSNCYEKLGKFDNVIVCHYRLLVDQLKSLVNIVNDYGTVIITGFSENHKCDNRISKDELIYRKDIEILFGDFELIDESEKKDQRGSFSTYVLRKQGCENR
jgi:SAM-dependent methyltransferase